MNERGRGCGGGTVDGVGSDGVGFGLSGWVEEEMEGRGEDREDRRVGKEVEESCVCRATRGRAEGKAGKDWGEHAGAELGWRVNFKDWSDSGWTQPIK